MWPPCLEGPGSNEDTMDEGGRNEPAWMRLVSSFKVVRATGVPRRALPHGPVGKSGTNSATV
jgi:hypothetical protein